MDSFNRTVSSSLEGIASPYLTETLQMILMADDVITTFKDDQDALKFKDLLYDFEKASGLTLNASKSKAYCFNVSSNTTLTGWGVPMVDIHSETFLYLGIPMNGLNWKEKIAKLLKKVPPLLDKPLQKHVKALVRETNRKIQPSKLFKVTDEKVMTPLWLGGFGLIDLSRQLHGRRASYIYAALTETCTPSTLNVRSILQTALNHVLGTTTTHFSWYHFLLQCDWQTDSGTIMTTTNIQATVSTFLRARFPWLTFQLESWFSLTEKSETHSSFAQSVTLDLNSLEAPDQELVKWIQLAGEATQITAMSFSSSSRRYYQAHKEEKLIVPRAFHYYHLFQTGHIQHRLGLNSTSNCQFCHSDYMETSNHLLDEYVITDLIWDIVRGGTATRLDSKNPPIQIQEKFLTRRIMPLHHMVKVDLYIHILIKFSTHIHSEQARKLLKVDIPECPTLEKVEKLVKKIIHRYQLPLRI
ncbi:unnamed protein product [Ambrosiozyma monospora]|uniref:Unnamed protein product n=1 Tax=Ambrosiozyma monospora TaxID=43982 RepID=A0ACB5SR94_AMBMO|nr:unnamed protein product [Ambrosiozyma monospora]